MGMIRITVGGSFNNPNTMEFSAMKAGHAAALGEAIKYLASLLPDAIHNDHLCQFDNEYPEDKFGIKK
jgi:hypothetical protein